MFFAAGGEFHALGRHAALKRLGQVVMKQKCAKFDQKLVLVNVIECMGAMEMMTEALGIIVLSIESVRN